MLLLIPQGQAATAALESFEDAFECLRGCPGGDGEPGKVVDNFLEKEDANLVLFNYVRELKEEEERLEKVRRGKGEVVRISVHSAATAAAGSGAFPTPQEAPRVPRGIPS